MTYKIAILIVTHNHQEYIKNLIDSCKCMPGISKYICDAASTDQTLETIKSEISGRSDFFILPKDILEGFSKNNNDLVREFQLFDHNFLLINPDCHFDEKSLSEFINISASIDGLGISAPEVHYPDGRIQTTWRKYPSLYSFFHRRFVKPTSTPANHYISKVKSVNAFQIEWALGALLYISNDLLIKNNNNLFDERYRLYCEDADLCLSAYANNLKVIGIPMDGIYHALQEKSSSRFSKYNYWNVTSGIKFMLKWNYRYLVLLRLIRSK